MKFENQILVGNVIEQLARLPDQCIQTVVTSPPYWGLRDYETATWDGGNSECDHIHQKGGRNPETSSKQLTNQGTLQTQYADTCKKCGAQRVDNQIGLEKTPEEFVEKLVSVFREVWRVLRDDGTLWLNLGDSYASAWPSPTNRRNIIGNPMNGGKRGPHRPERMGPGLKEKDVVGIPWRVAFALQADGWYLRCPIIWYKKNPMPEPVTDRPAMTHEYIFLMSKSAKYFYDTTAVRQQGSPKTQTVSTTPIKGDGTESTGEKVNKWMSENGGRYNLPDRHLRSVWDIATQPYPEAHFATFPEAIPERCILAGTSQKGACSNCRSPFIRQVEKPKAPEHLRNRGNGAKMDFHSRQTGAGQTLQDWYDAHPARTVGWKASCDCGAGTVACGVLDPFMGSGTTGLIARRLGRFYVGIELNPKYAELAVGRIRAGHTQRKRTAKVEKQGELF